MYICPVTLIIIKMKMNKIYWICALASFMFSICAGAQASKNVHATLNEATLYLNGAEMIHSATASLTKGEQEIIIEGLSSSSVDKNSMKITASNGVIISAYEYSTNYLTEKVLSSTAQKLQDSINIYRKKISALETDMSINKRLGELLKSGTDKTVSGSDKGLSFDELVKMMDYYKSKYKELAISADEYREKLKEYNESIRRLESQFNLEAVKNNRTSGIIKLTVNAPVAVNCHFTLSYYTTSASWAPYYDVNVESVERPVKFVMKAKARQTTGIDWEKIKLTLSTANPGNGKIAPLFSTWFLGFNETRAYQAQRSMVQNSYAYDLAEVRSADIVAPLAKSVEEKEIADDAGAVSPVYIYMINGEISDEATYNSLEPSSIKARDFYNAAQANE
jgi:uncharacterized protein (TIGR02231 family)